MENLDHLHSWQADVGFPILGADFLDKFDMLVDLRQEHLNKYANWALLCGNLRGSGQLS